MKKLLLSSLLMLWASAACAAAWSIEAFGGSSVNFPSPLHISQNGRPDINFNARYDTDGIGNPPYYAVRFGRWKNGRAWELELIHQMIFLKNGPSTVQAFSISHGYNLWLINRAWRTRRFDWRLGLGPVVAHPESTVGGRAFPENGGLFSKGYYFAGPAAQAAISKRFYPLSWAFVQLETKLTAAFARVKVAGGHANAPNFAWHWLFGIGFDIGSDG